MNSLIFMDFSWDFKKNVFESILNLFLLIILKNSLLVHSDMVEDMHTYMYFLT